jgi:L-amino acid N-acyltransferase YncA/mannose-6-phosphate isomerase-like protein (cupin superfamily)
LLLAFCCFGGLIDTVRAVQGSEQRRVEKPWGYEVWWAQNDAYAGKLLFVNAGHRLSLQLHRQKDESSYLLSGRLRLIFGPSKDELTGREIGPGESWRIEPEIVHSVEALEDSVVLEVSTPQLDDVVRLEDRYGRGMDVEPDHGALSQTGRSDVRAATAADAEAICVIYNAALAERGSTFETEPRSAGDFVHRIEDGRFPFLVAAAPEVIGWAGLGPYSSRACYAGIAECSVYVAADARGRGVGTSLTETLASAAERRGFHKLIGKLFTENTASVRLVERCGFTSVGLHRRHGQLDGEWRNVLVVERLLRLRPDTK